MYKIKLAVFDMAGTTVNEDNVVYKTVHQVFINAGYDITLDQVLEYGAGKEKQQAILDILTICTSVADPEKIAKELFDSFKPALEKAYSEADIKPTNGTEDLFRTLRIKGVKILLNTGYDKNTATSLINILKWKQGEDYDALLTSSDVTAGRPHPEMIQKGMHLFGITNPKEVMKVGDSVIDIEEGKNAGCGLTVGVLGGAQTKRQLQVARPDYIISELSDLQTILFA